MVIPVCLCSFGLRLALMNRGTVATVNERREFTFTEIINGAFRNARLTAPTFADRGCGSFLHFTTNRIEAATHQPASSQHGACRMEGEDEEASERTTRVVTALLILSPFLGAFCYVLALAQSASGQASAVIGLAGFAMCLGAAGLNWLRDAKATRDLWWIVLILNLFGR